MIRITDVFILTFGLVITSQIDSILTKYFQAALRALIDRATLDLNIPWEHQDPHKVAALCGAVCVLHNF